MRQTEPLGVALVRLGYANEEQIKSTILKQQQSRNAGKSTLSLGDLLVKKRIITSKQLSEVIHKTQDEKVSITDDVYKLATHLNVDIDGKKNIILFTGLFNNDGADHLSVQVAAALSLQTKSRTILIDADLRHENIDKHLKIKEQSGLSSYINDGLELSEIIFSTSFEKLDYISNGSTIVDFMATLHSSKFIELLETLSENYDQVIINSAPILTYPETSVMIPLCDKVILSVREGREKSDLHEAKRIMSNIKADLHGVVIYSPNEQ